MKYLLLTTLVLILIQCQKKDFRDDLIGNYEVHFSRNDDIIMGPKINYESDTIISVHKGASEKTFSVMGEDLEIGDNLVLKNNTIYYRNYYHYIGNTRITIIQGNKIPQ